MNIDALDAIRMAAEQTETEVKRLYESVAAERRDLDELVGKVMTDSFKWKWLRISGQHWIRADKYECRNGQVNALEADIIQLSNTKIGCDCLAKGTIGTTDTITNKDKFYVTEPEELLQLFNKQWNDLNDTMVNGYEDTFTDVTNEEIKYECRIATERQQRCIRINSFHNDGFTDCFTIYCGKDNVNKTDRGLISKEHFLELMDQVKLEICKLITENPLYTRKSELKIVTD